MKKLLGIVEGFYGKPWTWQARENVVKELSKWGYNAYVYAPKDDPYHRKLWKKAYPTDEEDRILKFASYCKDIGLRFYFTISPGLDITYSSEDDFVVLIDKLKRLHQKGVKGFGVLFDDIPQNLIKKEDKGVSSLEEAQNKLLIRLYENLKSLDCEISVLTCPTEYHGRGDSKYIKGFCKDLPQDLLVFWTGRSVCSPNISFLDTRYFHESTGHSLLYWDNYPVNDSLMKWELHLGPYNNRDTEILEYCDGIILNVMIQPLNSLIPLKTASDFFHMGKDYNPDLSWERAIKEIVPQEFVNQFRDFAMFNFKSCLSSNSAPLIIKDIQNRKGTEGWSFEKYLDELIKKHLASYRVLMKYRKHALIQESLPWLKKYGIFVNLLKQFEMLHYRGLLSKTKGIFAGKYYYLKFMLDPHEIFQLGLLELI